MPSLNSQPGFFKSLSPRGKIILFLGALLIASLIIALLLPKNNPNSQPGSDEYTDTRSGQTVSNPPGKTPEAFGNNGSQITILGIDKLLDHGLSTDQIKGVKKAFDSYSSKNNLAVKEVSIDISSIESVPTDQTSSRQAVTMNVLIDRKTNYDAKIEYFNLTQVELYLSSNAKVVFDSGIIEGHD
jgi:hypothetical protein